MATEHDAAADNIEKLYKNFGILADANTSGNISQVRMHNDFNIRIISLSFPDTIFNILIISMKKSIWKY